MNTHPVSMSAPSSLANVSRETLSKLESYAELLLKWNKTINLIGATTISDLWARHVEDSLQLSPQIPTRATVMDMGSGAGLPGLVLAIARPDLQLDLVERDQRKAAFLLEAKAKLKLDNVAIINKDIADHVGQYRIVTARALASLDALFSLSIKHANAETSWVLLKGKAAAEELQAAKQNWEFECCQIPSITHAESSVVTVTKLHPKFSIIK